MATAINLDPLTERLIDDLMASGQFAERSDVLRHGVRLAHEQDLGTTDTLDTELMALLERRIAAADADESGGYSVDEVFDELERRCREDIERSGQAGG